MDRRNHVYVVPAIILALLLGMLVGNSWAEVTAALAVFGFAVAFDGGRRLDIRFPSESIGRPSQGQVVHYAQMARAVEGERLRQTANNPFERALLERQDWLTLLPGELQELGRAVRDYGDQTDRC